MSERFYTSAALATGEFNLTGAEAHHIATVRRLAPGDRITLFNGTGVESAAEIVALTKKSVSLSIHSIEPVDRELPFPLVVASAIPKGDRADFLIEKLTELGVTRFIPLITRRSVVVPKDATLSKFTRAVIESSKQCGRNHLMAVEPPLPWRDLLHRKDLPDTRIVLHPASGPVAELNRQEGIVAAVGPEGGFTAEEVADAAEAGWRTIGLGPRVLRVETAAIAAAVIAARPANQ